MQERGRVPVQTVTLSSFPLVPPHLAMDPLQCSPALNASQGITANPDISGIGVRTAIYTQVVLSLVHPLVAGSNGKIDDFEMQSLTTVYLSILLPGCALLISAIIQAKTFGLSAYHAMIVLFLSWINNISVLTFFAYILGDQRYGRRHQELEELGRLNSRRHEITELDREWVEADNLGKWCLLEKVEKMLDKLKLDKNGIKSTPLNRGVWELEIQQWSLWRKKKIMTTFLPNQVGSQEFQRRWEEDWESNKRKQETILLSDPDDVWSQLVYRKSILLTGALASMHLTLLSAFGWWFWSTLPNFGINQECIPSIRFVFFTKSIPITSAVLRSRSKSIYIFSSLPVINIVIWMYIFVMAIVISMLMLLPVAGLIILARRKWAPAKVPASATTSRPVSTEEPYSLPGSAYPSDDVSYILVRGWNRLSRPFFAQAIITTLTVQILLITLTELTIAHNQHLIQSKEGDWTFGQTLAITLTLIPLIEVVKFLWEKRPWAPKESPEDGEAGWSVKTAETREALEGGETREAQEGRGEVGADDLV
jgi:hypothetical protein